MPTNWRLLAACSDKQHIFYRSDTHHLRNKKTVNPYTTQAKAICATCIVRAPCLRYALSNGIQWLVWGGLTWDERKALLRSQPDVDTSQDAMFG